MDESFKNVLLIENRAADAEIVGRFLEIAGGGAFCLTHLSTLRAALDAVSQRPCDLVLLDMRLPDSGDLDPLQEMLRRVGATPIVVMTSSGDDAEGARRVREGAQDFLVKGRFDAQLLVRVMRYALERAELLRSVEEMRCREQVERELRALSEIAASPGIPPRSLRDASPAAFAELTRRYAELLGLAMARRVFKQDPSELATKLRAFTGELARIKSGPREIVDIHSATLERVLAAESDVKGQAHLEEGRLLLLETMGAMIREYRRASLHEEPTARERDDRRAAARTPS
jgi:DNA-binding NarL/FixJ family response regulator